MKKNTVEVNICGEPVSFFSPYMDEHGNPVRRTPITHPYNYDSYLIWRMGDNDEVTGSMDSDRLTQWDFAKHDRLCQKIFGNKGQLWNNRDPELIEQFLREWTEKPNLRLIYVLQCCNQATGFPLWHFAYSTKPPKAEKDE